VRLTHNPDHPLASGYPSLGWPDVPRAFIDAEDGLWTLEGDFLGVPNVFADIMEAGGYDRISCGLYEDVKVGEFTAPLAIDHVAVLGTTHPAVTQLKGISAIHKLYENEMAAREGVQVSAAYLFEDAGLVDKEGGEMPQFTAEQLTSLGVSSESELKAKLAKAARVDEIERDAESKTKELEAAHEKIRLAAADGFIATHRDKFPPALDDHFRAIHMGLSATKGAVEFERPSKDGTSQTVKLDPVASLNAIVAKFGKAVELQSENAPEGGKDQEHMTDEEKKTAEEAAKKKAEEKKDGDDDEPKEGNTDEPVELSRGGGVVTRSKMARDQETLASFLMKERGLSKGAAMSEAAVELQRAGYGTDAYIAPEGLKKTGKDAD
ncbi:MAG: hypothetical protein JXB46_11110, partial [Candidatus Eisenbacteria bacterium]|nr:hypothetical protein [Candidatus Eisenbacteria bacterium]